MIHDMWGIDSYASADETPYPGGYETFADFDNFLDTFFHLLIEDDMTDNILWDIWNEFDNGLRVIGDWKGTWITIFILTKRSCKFIRLTGSNLVFTCVSLTLEWEQTRLSWWEDNWTIFRSSAQFCWRYDQLVHRVGQSYRDI